MKMTKKKNSLPFSPFSWNYQNYWKLAFLSLIMKDCQEAKYWVPTIRLVKYVERGNLPMILYRIAKK